MLEELLKNKKVFIFDLDGTLIDSVSVWNEIDRILLKELVNAELDEETINHERDNVIAKSTSDDPYIDYVAYLIKKYNINMSLEDVINYRVNITNWYLINKIMPTSYAQELLSLLRLHNKTLILATTTNMSCVEIYMNKNNNTIPLELDKFDLILTMQDVKKFKPDPEIHWKSMSILEYLPKDAVVIEDTVNGCLAAKNAGLDVIAVKEKHSMDRENELRSIANYYADSLEEIYNYFMKFPVKSLKNEKKD